jgi:hypothetical protein
MPWPRGRSLDGGLDRIRTPAGVGTLWVCGKHVVGPDPEAVRSRIGPRTTVASFNQRSDIERYDGYVEWLERSEWALWFPIPDFHAPSVHDAMPMLEAITTRLGSDDAVLLHCSAGMGRAGTMAVCTLMVLGVSRDDALARVRDDRPGAGPEVGAQRALVGDLQEHLASRR